MNLYLNLANNNHTGILYGLLTETMLVTSGNPGPLPLRSKIRQIRAESGTTTPVRIVKMGYLRSRRVSFLLQG